MIGDKNKKSCKQCDADGARLYESYSFLSVGEITEPVQSWLCVLCARLTRRTMLEERAAQTVLENDPPQYQLTRDELIAKLDRFWAESGAGEICRGCHEQGTGCCPPMCRHLSTDGCIKKNVFCTSFVCSALLNAISECDPATGRLLRWVKGKAGAAEFRIYEMVTRVPSVDREHARPLLLPNRYPGPLALIGEPIRDSLLALTEEVLEIRRRWREEERQQVAGVQIED